MANNKKELITMESLKVSKICAVSVVIGVLTCHQKEKKTNPKPVCK